MAGSWNHAIGNDGKLLVKEDLNKILEKPHDWEQFAEEAYGMMYWLAEMLSRDTGHFLPGELIEFAQRNYEEGLKVSPGIDGRLEEKSMWQLTLIDPETGFKASGGIFRAQERAQEKLDQFNEHKKAHPTGIIGEIEEVKVL